MIVLSVFSAVALNDAAEGALHLFKGSSKLLETLDGPAAACGRFFPGQHWPMR